MLKGAADGIPRGAEVQPCGADGTPRGVDLQSRVGVCALVSPCELRSAKVATFKADCNVRAFLFQQD